MYKVTKDYNNTTRWLTQGLLNVNTPGQDTEKSLCSISASKGKICAYRGHLVQGLSTNNTRTPYENTRTP
jgi:hypothetical protein